MKRGASRRWFILPKNRCLGLTGWFSQWSSFPGRFFSQGKSVWPAWMGCLPFFSWLHICAERCLVTVLWGFSISLEALYPPRDRVRSRQSGQKLAVKIISLPRWKNSPWKTRSCNEMCTECVDQREQNTRQPQTPLSSADAECFVGAGLSHRMTLALVQASERCGFPLELPRMTN